MRTLDWYFDFISPFAYFGLHELPSLPPDVRIDYKPVLFAALLDHWGQKGPAEIPPKRTWTYRSCIWWASQRGIDFRVPAAHPFNPLPYLRLSIAAGNRPDAVMAIYRAIWTTGVDASDPMVWQGLAADLGIDPARLGDATVKNELRRNTETAAARGVFGVPTLMLGEVPFWGADAMDFARACLADPGLLERGEMARAANLPQGVTRVPR
jgi:2-hydroxychromene-2-carboxylate isomerase